MPTPKTCKSCYKSPLQKDEIAACKKLIDPKMTSFFCLDCLADYLECSVEELGEKIEEFKADGCKLFQ